MEIILSILVVLGTTLLTIGICFLINAGIVAILAWGLVQVGITTICGWTVAFSWPLVVVFTVIMLVLQSIFKTTITKKSDD